MSTDSSHLREQCLFCNPAAHQQGQQVLLRSDNLYLFAGIGPLVEGYIIITPYRCDDSSVGSLHSFSVVPPALIDEAIFLRGLVSEFYREEYGSEVSMHFEHGRAGTCFPGQGDTKHCHHAHLCCYPCSFPLWEDMQGLDGVEVKDVAGIAYLEQAVKDKSYLFVESSTINHLEPYISTKREVWAGRVALVEEDSIPSQYLRRLLSTQLGDEFGWDWAATPQIPLVEALVKKFRQWLSRTEKYDLATDPDGVFRLNFVQSVEKSNRLGNNDVAYDFARIWSGRLQYNAIGSFLRKLPSAHNRSPRILDVGCGPGQYLIAFGSLGLDCMGVDISDSMVDLARLTIANRFARAENSLTPIPSVERMSLLNLELASEMYDGIWFSAVAVHVPRQSLVQCLIGLRDSLIDNGIFYFSAQSGRGSVVRREGRVFFYYSEEELRGYFEEARLDVTEMWEDDTSQGSRGSTATKHWLHFILRKRESPVLSDLGERGVLERIRHLVPQPSDEYIQLGIGDDCASVKPNAGDLIVITTDPCPQPVITMLGETDFWYYGWFSMVISLSDLAAMGARPLGMLLAIEAMNTMKVHDLDRFYAGVIEAGQMFHCPIIGGNVKDSSRFSCVSTAIGSVSPQEMLRRDAARPGDRIVILGDMGMFWSGVIHKLEKIPLELTESTILMRNLRRPNPRLFEGRMIAEKQLARCAMDSSDGLVACFYEIARSSKVDLHIDLGNVEPHPLVARVAAAANIDFRKIMLAWGDWQLVLSVPEGNLTTLKQLMDHQQCPTTVVGSVVEGQGRVWLHDHSGSAMLNYIASERFTNRSYFSHGLDTYLSTIRKEPLTLNPYM